MSAPIPDTEPTEIIAGDTIAWTKDLSDYPATDWTLTYYLTGPSRITIAATASGRTFSVSKSVQATAAYAPGIYDWQAFVSQGSQGSERYKVGEGRIEILENPATAGKNYDTRSINKQILDALETALLQNAGRSERRYRIEAAGREFEFYTHADLITAIEKFRGFVKAEEDALKIARGENTGKDILVRFT